MVGRWSFPWKMIRLIPKRPFRSVLLRASRSNNGRGASFWRWKMPLRLACFVNYPLVNQRWQWKIPRGSDGNIHKWWFSIAMWMISGGHTCCTSCMLGCQSFRQQELGGSGLGSTAIWVFVEMVIWITKGTISFVFIFICYDGSLRLAPHTNKVYESQPRGH